MKSICIIPARIGSKRIKKKNIKIFIRKPIISYAIVAAKKSKLFKKIYVSTDSTRIAKIAKKYGADVPFLRNKNLSRDNIPTINVIRDFLKKIEKNKKLPKVICYMYGSNPFVRYKDLIKAYKILNKKGINYVLPVSSFDYPPQRALKINFVKNKVNMINKNNLLKSSQKLNKLYHDAGQFYFAKTKNLMKDKKIFSNKTKIIKIKRFNNIDIDTYEDWKLAEKLFLINKLNV